MGLTQIFFSRPEKDDRPTASSRVLEVRMVCLDTTLEVAHFAPGRGAVTLGEDPRNDFVVGSDHIARPRQTLLREDDGGWTLLLPESTELLLRDGEGHTHTLEALRRTGRVHSAGPGPHADEAGACISLALDDQAVLVLGETTFLLQQVRPADRIARDLRSTLDFHFTKVLSTTLMAHLLFVAALLFTPIDTASLSEDLFRNPNRFTTMILHTPKTPRVAFARVETSRRSARASQAPGTFGKKIASKREADPAQKGAPVVDVSKREADREKVLQTGLLAILNGRDATARSSVFGPAGLGQGINDALGGLTPGAGTGTAHGVGGLVSRGLGPGGGGNTLGIGGLSTRGRGPRTPGPMGEGGRRPVPASLDRETTRVVGGLDKSVIARIVRRHQNEIKYCYERSLQKNPSLYGKVAVVFVIDPTGAVAGASLAHTTLGDAEAEGCILTRVRRWRFPPPRGGGVVQVSYPWIFKPGG